MTSSTAALPINAASIVINGYRVRSQALANNTVVFSDGAVGTVTAATGTTLTVTLGTKPTAAGAITATVTTDSQSSGAVQVAKSRSGCDQQHRRPIAERHADHDQRLRLQHDRRQQHGRVQQRRDRAPSRRPPRPRLR